MTSEDTHSAPQFYVPWILKHSIRVASLPPVTTHCHTQECCGLLVSATRQLIYLHLEVTNMGGAAGGMPWPRTSPLSPQGSSVSSSLAQKDMMVSLQHRTPLVSLKGAPGKTTQRNESVTSCEHTPAESTTLLSAGSDGKGLCSVH